MILQIAAVLDDATVDAMRRALDDPTLWEGGAATALGRARAAKTNLQGRDLPTTRGVIDKARQALLSHEIVRNAAVPARIARIMLNRYDAGMRYGDHVDAPFIDGERSDVSFALFLSDPSSYDGGELVIDSAGAEDRVRGEAGSVVLYPSTAVHRVEEVTRGSRLAVVGWFRSRLRSAEMRSMHFEIARIEADVGALGGPTGLLDRIANLKNNFLRAHGD